MTPTLETPDGRLVDISVIGRSPSEQPDDVMDIAGARRRLNARQRAVVASDLRETADQLEDA